MSGAQRRKGREGEAEARFIFSDAGFAVLPLQPGRVGRGDAGDFVAALYDHPTDEAPSVRLVLDSKRREKVRVLEWSRALEAIARPGETAVTVWRQSREPWRVTLLAEDFARLLTR